MKLIKLTTLFIAAICLASCDDTTDIIGQTTTNRVDGLNISDARYNVVTESAATGAVLSNNSNGIIGMVKDPETNNYVTGNYMAQFSTLSSFELDTLDYIRYAHGGEYKNGVYTGGKVTADSCYLIVNYESAYGDTLAPMKVTAYEMKKPMEEGQNYYSDFNPIAQGYVDTENGYKASSTYSLKNKYFKIYLNNPYTKNGIKYANYGEYLMLMRKDHPEYFKNNYQFVHNVCPGFYIKHESGIGNVAKVNVMQMVFCWERWKNIKSYDGLRDSTEKRNYSYPFLSTQEVLQTNYIENDPNSINSMLEESQCTYIKSPAGIYTTATLPVENIMRGHEKDTLALASVTFPRMNNEVSEDEYTFATPDNILMIPVDSLKSFFEHGNITNYRTSYTAAYNSSSSSTPKNAYTFNNIGNLITEMYKVPVAKRTANWNKVALLPVSISYVTRDSYQYVSKITHDMGLTTTRLFKGDNSTDSEGKPASPVQIKVIYSKFKE